MSNFHIETPVVTNDFDPAPSSERRLVIQGEGDGPSFTLTRDNFEANACAFVVIERPDVEECISLDPEAVQALYDALGVLLDEFITERVSF